MAKVHALLVGIDTYRRPELALQGCVNDIEAAERVLRSRIDAADLSILALRDHEATRAGIVHAFRSHLGSAGPGDIAVFWFSGHGSTGPLPTEIPYAESSGMCQTTVCHDSRAGVPDLYDKELAVLVREVVATGAQLVTVKDSCHSRSGMRGATGLRPRVVPAADTPPALHDLLPELTRGAHDAVGLAHGAQVPGHVALSACDEWEPANEAVFPGGVVRGVFSEALCRALARLGPDATYRQVLSHARSRVEGGYRQQLPALEAADDLADRTFLGGVLRPRAAHVTMRHIHRRWEVDLGAVHGVVADSRLAVHGADPLREVQVVEVHTDHSVVWPLDWSPEPELQYDVVLTDVPLPPVAVSITTSPGTAAQLADAVRTAGPGGGPSPHIRIVEPDEDVSTRLVLRVRAVQEDRRIEITSADHVPLAPPVAADRDGVAGVVRDLEHIARWLQIRNLDNPASALEGAVRIEVLPGDGGAPFPPGELELAYTAGPAGWEPPSVVVRLRNTTDRRLFCVLLDLTDRYRVHADLFPGEHVAGDWTAAVGRGAPITFSLPPGRRLEPGASVTDWLVLLVSETPFSSAPFTLPRLGELPAPSPRSGTRGITGVLDRLGLVATTRDAGVAAAAAADWSVDVVEISTRVPDGRG